MSATIAIACQMLPRVGAGGPFRLAGSTLPGRTRRDWTPRSRTTPPDRHPPSPGMRRDRASPASWPSVPAAHESRLRTRCAGPSMTPRRLATSLHCPPSTGIPPRTVHRLAGPVRPRPIRCRFEPNPRPAAADPGMVRRRRSTATSCGSSRAATSRPAPPMPERRSRRADRYRRFLDALGVAVYTTDADGRITLLQRGGRGVLGPPPGARRGVVRIVAAALAGRIADAPRRVPDGRDPQGRTRRSAAARRSPSGPTARTSSSWPTRRRCSTTPARSSAR